MDGVGNRSDGYLCCSFLRHLRAPHPRSLRFTLLKSLLVVVSDGVRNLLPLVAANGVDEGSLN